MNIKPVRLINENIGLKPENSELMGQDIIRIYYKDKVEFDTFSKEVSKLNNTITDGMIVWSYFDSDSDLYVMCVQTFEEYKEIAERALNNDQMRFNDETYQKDSDGLADRSSYTTRPD